MKILKNVDQYMNKNNVKKLRKIYRKIKKFITYFRLSELTILTQLATLLKIILIAHLSKTPLVSYMRLFILVHFLI